MPRLLALLLAAALLQGCVGKQPSAQSTRPTNTSSASISLTLPARWWLWAESFPVEQNPIADDSGAACGLHQPEDVWFLAGTFGGTVNRRCTVPVGKPIFFPVLNQICTVSDGESSSEALRRCRFSPDRATATLDGDPLRVTADGSQQAFTFDARRGSLTGFKEGANEAVAWGMWVGPVLLDPGAHLLRFQGVAGSFRLRVTYRLNSE
jgi:hypothetical protein